MSKTKSLIVLGGCSLETSPKGGFKSKTPICQYLFDLCEHFDEVTLFAPFNPTNLFTGQLEHPKLKVHATNATALLKLIGRILLGEKKYLLLHLPNASALAPAIPFIKWRTKKIAVYLGIDFTYEERNRSGIKRLMRGGFRAAHRTILRWADVVIARGQYLRELCRKFNANVFETVPLGHMSPARAIGFQERDENRILFVGKVTRDKGIDVLLTALGLLTQKRETSGVEADVLGDGMHREWAVAESGRMKLTKEARFHGWVDNPDELDEFWRRASVLVVPTTASEGVPRVIEEAMIRNVPVIATRIGGIADQFRNGEVLLVPPGDAEALARAIASVLTDANVRSELLARASTVTERLAESGTAGYQHAKLLLGIRGGPKKNETNALVSH